MKKIGFFVLFFLLLIFFIISSQAIVSVKLQELRFGILRDQLMNYELSSQTLRERLKQMFLSKDDYLTEVKVNIMESGVMNSETQGLDLKMSPKDRLGLFVINSVRLLNFKPSLKLEEQQQTILRLQFAFYMERTRKYPIASKKYQELEDSNLNSLSDEMAFTLLHHGYCLVMMGEREKAYVKLKKAIDLFPGSHYAENANLLISFLEDSENKKLEMKNGSKKPEDLAYSLFQSGDYEETLRTLELIPTLSKDQNYIKARSMEELGRTSNAVQEYIQLVKQKENKAVAIKANRRLLLIGNFYQENKSLVSFSKQEATKLGDSKAVQNIEIGKSLVLKPVIIEKILNSEPSSNLNVEEAKELQEIKESIKLSLEDSKEETTKLAEVVQKENIPLVPEISETKEESKITKELITESKIKIKLRDGREVLCVELKFEAGIALLNLGDFVLNLPLEMITSVEKTPRRGNGFRILLEGGEEMDSLLLTRTKEGEWSFPGKSKTTLPANDVKLIRL